MFNIAKERPVVMFEDIRAMVFSHKANKERSEDFAEMNLYVNSEHEELCDYISFTLFGNVEVNFHHNNSGHYCELSIAMLDLCHMFLDGATAEDIDMSGSGAVR